MNTQTDRSPVQEHESRDAGHLLAHCTLFIQHLRGLGVPIAADAGLMVGRALPLIDLHERQEFRATLRTVLITRREDLATFARAFDRFWPTGPQDATPAGRVRTLPGAGSPNRRQGDLTAVGQKGTEPPATTALYSRVEVLRHKDFGRMDAQEVAQVEAFVSGGRWLPARRRSRRRRPGRRGDRPHLRHTLRHTLRHGGEVLELARSRRILKPRPLVLLCDVSGSMTAYARVLLLFMYALQRQAGPRRQVESFVFGTRLSRVTGALATPDPRQALETVSGRVADWGGGTRTGDALHHFNREWAPRLLGHGAWVLIMSDGFDRGDTELLERTMARLHRSSKRLLWLNPLLGDPEYRPLTRGMQAALPHVDEFLPIHNLAALADLAQLLNQPFARIAANSEKRSHDHGGIVGSDRPLA